MSLKPWQERWYIRENGNNPGIEFPEDPGSNCARAQLAVYAPELYRQLEKLLAYPEDNECRRKAKKVLRHARGEYPKDFHGQWAGDDEL